MRIKKQVIWKLHSWFGLVAGLGLLVIGLTGSILVFTTEIEGLLKPGETKTEVPPSAKRQSFDQLYKAVEVFPGRIVTGWQLDVEDASATDRVWLKTKGEEEWEFVHVDPYTAELLSDPAGSKETLTGWLLQLHYSFFGDHVGMLIAGLFAIMLLVLGLSGVLLYRDFWKNFLRLRWGRSARIFFSDLHKMVGISSVIFNVILGFTGAWWNLSHLLGHLGEEEPSPEQVEITEREVEWASVEGMSGMLSEEIDGFVTRYIAFSRGDESTITFYGHHGNAGPLRGLYGSNITFDGETGERVKTFDIRDASALRQIYDSFMPLHYGTFGGWPVKVLWSVLGLAPGVLAVSGFLIWNSRRRARKVVKA